MAERPLPGNRAFRTLEAPTRELDWFFWLGALACALVGIVLAWIAHGYLPDDAYIYHRYVRNFVRGDGLVYNVGERFNALTSPLFTYASLALTLASQDIERNQLVLSAGALIVASWLALRLFWREGLRIAGWTAGLLVVSGPFYYLTFGLESTLFIALLLLALWFLPLERPLLLGLCVGLVVLTRPDGVVLAPVCALFLIRHGRWRTLGLATLAFVLTGLPTALFNLLYYGQLLPHTLTAKAAQGASGLFGHGILIFHVGYLTDQLFRGTPWLPWAPVLVIVCALPLLRRSPVFGALGLFVVLQTAFLALAHVPSYHWYYSAHFLALWLLFAWGTEALASWYEDRRRARPSAWPRRVQYALYGLLVATNLGQSLRHLPQPDPKQHYRTAGLWIRDHTPPEASIACVEVGIIGWYSERPIIDVLGLVSFHNAKLLGEGDSKGWMRHYSPDLLLTHVPPWVLERSMLPALASGAYVLVEGFSKSVQGLRLMGRKTPAADTTPADPAAEPPADD